MGSTPKNNVLTVNTLQSMNNQVPQGELYLI